MKWIYYGFGAFIGFVCGTVIEFIFYLLEQSGNRVISNMVRDYGILGRFIAEWSLIFRTWGSLWE